MSLLERLGAHDISVLAAFVAVGLKTQQAPDWQSAWQKLSDLGRHQLESADPAEVFAAALEAWANAPKKLLERTVRKGLKAGLRKTYQAEAVRVIARAQMERRQARAVEASA